VSLLEINDTLSHPRCTNYFSVLEERLNYGVEHAPSYVLLDVMCNAKMISWDMTSVCLSVCVSPLLRFISVSIY